MTLGNATANVAVNDTLLHAEQGALRGRQDRRERSAQERARAAARARGGRRREARARPRRGGPSANVDYPAASALSIVTPDSIPIVEADPDVAVREALKNASSIEQTELDKVQSRRDISRARSSTTGSTPRSRRARDSTRPRRRSGRPIRVRSASRRSRSASTCRWCSGARAGGRRGAKADEQRTTANNKIAPRPTRRGRAVLGARAPAGAANVCSRRRPTPCRKAVRGRAQPLHHRQDQQHATCTSRRTRRTRRCSRTCRRSAATGRRTTICAASRCTTSRRSSE